MRPRKPFEIESDETPPPQPEYDLQSEFAAIREQVPADQYGLATARAWRKINQVKKTRFAKT